MSFPIDRKNEREFAPGFTGDVVTCDIDRTYLATRFSSMKSMARIPFEFGVDKRAIAGMAVLLKELRRGPGASSRQTPLYFVSASPPLLRPAIERKMLLDGLEYDGTTFKDWTGVIKSLRPARFREQIGFKITALFTARLELPAEAHELLIGDDLESDALAFTLYADILARRVPTEAVVPTLLRFGVAEDDARAIAAMRGRLSPCRGVRRIYIRLERYGPEAFKTFGGRVAAGRSALQLAAAMLQDGAVAVAGAARVGADLRRRGMGSVWLAEQLGDAVRRALIAPDDARTLAARLELGPDAIASLPRSAEPGWAVEAPPDAPWTPAALLAARAASPSA